MRKEQINIISSKWRNASQATGWTKKLDKRKNKRKDKLKSLSPNRRTWSKRMATQVTDETWDTYWKNTQRRIAKNQTAIIFWEGRGLKLNTLILPRFCLSVIAEKQPRPSITGLRLSTHTRTLNVYLWDTIRHKRTYNMTAVRACIVNVPQLVPIPRHWGWAKCDGAQWW